MRKNSRNSNQSMVYGLSPMVHSPWSMARRLSTVVCFLLAILSMAVACTQNNDSASRETYTCPMHPTVVSDKPGTCPVCGMDLVRKARKGEETEITGDLSKLLNSTNETIVSSIKTIKADNKRVPLQLKSQGLVTYDTRNIHTIAARISGRLEKVFLSYAFQPITKGQKVVEIYSPEIITAQRELLYLLESDARNIDLIESAKNKIKLLGASDAAISTIIQSKEARSTFAVYSPFSGYLVPAQGQAPAINPASTMGSNADDDVMNASPLSATSTDASQFANAESFLREGTYVSVGQTLFKVVNPSSLRIELDVPASLAGSIKKGASIKLDLGSGGMNEAVVDFIQPFFTKNQEFVKLRVYVNTKNLHIGHLVNATIEVTSTESLWLPKEAVLDLGLDQIVFVRENGVFKPKKISIGAKAEGLVEVRHGLATYDEIAANAQYLVDSESFVKAN